MWAAITAHELSAINFRVDVIYLCLLCYAVPCSCSIYIRQFELFLLSLILFCFAQWHAHEKFPQWSKYSFSFWLFLNFEFIFKLSTRTLIARRIHLTMGCVCVCWCVNLIFVTINPTEKDWIFRDGAVLSISASISTPFRNCSTICGTECKNLCRKFQHRKRSNVCAACVCKQC